MNAFNLFIWRTSFRLYLLRIFTVNCFVNQFVSSLFKFTHRPASPFLNPILRTAPPASTYRTIKFIISHLSTSGRLISSSPDEILKITYESIYISLSGSFVNDIFIVIVAEAAAQLLVVHFRFVFANAPPPRDLQIESIFRLVIRNESSPSKVAYLIRIGEFEFPSVVGPRDEILAGFIHEQLEQKLPQLDRSGSSEAGNAIRRRVVAEHRLLQPHRRHVRGVRLEVGRMRVRRAPLLGQRRVAGHRLERGRVVCVELGIGFVETA